ncbi:Tetratricopeptide TPR-4 [Penicillium expansum]|nr:Tetratricopeptide TPR-4 [Penicillium expansum]
MDKHPPSLESLQREVSDLTASYHGRGWTTKATDLELAMTTAGNRILAADTNSDATTITLEELAACVKAWMQAKSWIVAEDLAIRVLDACKDLKGEQDFMTMTAMHNLASAYLCRGQLDQAADLSARVTKLRQEILGETHPPDISFDDESSFHISSSRALEREVVAVSRDIFGTNHPFTLTSMSNLASTYREQARWSDAERLEKEVVASSEAVLGETHPQTLISISNLASTYRNQGRLEEAKDLGGKATAVLKEVLGERHPNTLIAMVDLAVTYQMMSQSPDAEILAAQSLHLMEETIGKDHPYTLRAMANLGLIYQSQSKWEVAGGIAEKVHSRRETAFGTDHPDTVAALEDLRRVAWVEAADQNAQRTLN